MSDLIPTQTNELTMSSQHLDQNPAAIYLASLKPTGRRSMRQVLNLVAREFGTPEARKPATKHNKRGEEIPGEEITWLYCPWAELRFGHVSAIRAKLEETYKPATVNKALAAIRGALRSAWLSGQMTAEDYHKAAAVKGVRGTTLPAGRELSSGEIGALMAACENDTTPAGARDAAIIGLAYACGLRREEIAMLSLASYDLETGKLIIRGKGSKERIAWLTNGAARAMSDWLSLRGSDGDALFVAINKGGRLDVTKPMTPQAVYNMLVKRAEQAGVKSFSPHDLRRSCASDLLDAGADIATVAKILGHASVTTTQRYDRRPEEAKRKAAGLLHVPYRGRLVGG